MPFVVSLQGCIPQLRRLCLQWQDPEDQYGFEAIHAFKMAPLLAQVNIAHNYIIPIPIFLPTIQLTHYRLDAPWPIHWDILKEALNLKEAYIIVTYPEDSVTWEEAADLEVLNLPSINCLFISHSRVLNYIITPNANLIIIELGYDEIPGLQQWTESFSHHFHPQQLVLVGEPTADLTTQILRKIPTIVGLGLFMNTNEVRKNELNDIIATLTIASDAMVAPHLRSISLGSAHRDRINYALYLAMIQSRRKSGSCTLKLAECVDSGRGGPGLQIIQEFKLLGKNGLDFSFSSGHENYEASRYHWSLGGQWTSVAELR
ncbi:hypothetical protein K438DRAFT_1987367 [Mycena galopus ATCC 62051]|nr:hypothetical protein K438DRAFT_1987367 [Mycena galopus ATCC 62051]